MGAAKRENRTGSVSGVRNFLHKIGKEGRFFEDFCNVKVVVKIKDRFFNKFFFRFGEREKGISRRSEAIPYFFNIRSEVEKKPGGSLVFESRYFLFGLLVWMGRHLLFLKGSRGGKKQNALQWARPP